MSPVRGATVCRPQKCELRELFGLRKALSENMTAMFGRSCMLSYRAGKSYSSKYVDATFTVSQTSTAMSFVS